MIQRRVMVTNPLGLHARPASKIINYIKSYSGEIIIKANGKEGKLKSLLTLLSMGITAGTEITLEISGENEEQFADELVRFISTLRD